MKNLTFLLLSSLFTFHFSLAQEVIYVDISNVSGIEDGSAAHPFNTIHEGLSIAQNGYHLSIAEGTYQEDTLMITQNISIQGQNRDSTLVEGIFILSYSLDTTEVSISELSCFNVLLSETSLAIVPLTIQNCRLQTFTNELSKLDSTVRLNFINNLIDDSIHLYISLCLADIHVEDCTVGSDFSFFSASLKDGKAIFRGNQVNGNFTVSTVSRKDTLHIDQNDIQDSLFILSVASYPDFITENIIGKGVKLTSVSSQGIHFLNNKVINGRLAGTYTAIINAELAFNEFSNGGIDLNAKSAGIVIRENSIQSNGQESGIRLKSTAGGYLENNTITLPYVAPTGIPFENDSTAVCGLQVYSIAFPGMKGNHIRGGSYGAYIRAVSAGDILENFIEESHTGMYIRTVSSRIDSSRMEHCVADGLVVDFYPEYDTSSVLLNHNLIRNNGGHGIRARGIVRMGKSEDPGTGNNVMSKNEGFDLYIEIPVSLMDTIWAQNNAWSHSTEADVGLYDIFDASDDPEWALVIYLPVLPNGIAEVMEPVVSLWPNPTLGQFKVQSSVNRIERTEIVDFFGKMVEAEMAKSGDGGMSYDVSFLPAGIYFVRINTKAALIVKKLIKN